MQARLTPYRDYTGYAPVNTPDVVNDPNHWQPLRIPDGHGRFVVQKFITPQWGKVIPFALKKAAQFRPKPPQPFGGRAVRKGCCSSEDAYGRANSLRSSS